MKAVFSCRHASRLTSEGQDRRLSLRERMALSLHTMMCGACRAYGKQLSWLDSVLRGRRDAAALGAPPTLEPASKQRLKVCLREAAEQSKEPGCGEPPDSAS